MRYGQLIEHVTTECGAVIKLQRYLHWEEKGVTSVVATETLLTKVWCVHHLTLEKVQNARLDIVTLW
jgi:hypothetical protein